MESRRPTEEKRFTLSGKTKAAIASAFAVLAIAGVVIGAGVGARTKSANASSAPNFGSSSQCPAGTRALTFTNNCSFDVYLGEVPAGPQLQGTPSCTTDADCNTNASDPTGPVLCVNGACTETCSSDSDCGANQTCWPTNKTNTPVSGTGHTISNCVFSNFEPTSLSSPAPSSGSAWQLPANGGESVICIPEGPINGQTGPQGGTVAAGGACTQNSDCVSNTCAGDSPKFDQLCKTGEANCQCKAVFTWGGTFWGRTECTNPSITNNQLTCQTGNCGAANGAQGALDCNGTASAANPFAEQPPAYVGEFTLEVPPVPSTYNTGAQDFYDISNVSGFNVGFSIVPVQGTFFPAFTNSNIYQCGPAGAETWDSSGNPLTYCPFDLAGTSGTCPAVLQYLDTNSNVAGCWNPSQGCSTGALTTELGCSDQVPLLCQQDADCPYNQNNPQTQTLTCLKAGGQAFGQCKCNTTSDCPPSFTCNGGICQNSAATWAELYGCSGYYNLSPYNGSTTTAKDVGIVCGCPSWSKPGTCITDNINWEKVPAGSSGVPTSTATPSTNDLFLAFHNSCPYAYSYAYDDLAATYGCTNDQSTGPSYNITFCPGAGGPTPTATPTSTATATATATASATPSTTPTATATPTATPSVTPTATATASRTPTPTATATASRTPTPTASATASPSPSATATTTATATITPSATPTATPTTQGSAAVLSQGSGKYNPGDTADLGSFGYQPTDGKAQQIDSITVKVGRPGDFSSLTLTASIDGEQVGSATVASPDIAKETVFTFSPVIDVPGNASVTFALSGVISGASSRLDLASPVRLAGIVGGGRPGSMSGAGPLMLALSVFGLVMAPLSGTGRRRRSAIIAGAILMLATGLAGCGGSSSGGPNSKASTQQVLAMAITEGGNQISISGLPLALGTITKK